MSKNAYVGVENFANRNLPTGYTQVEYIQSSGTQWIDTGFSVDSTNIEYLRMVADTAFLDTTLEYNIHGAVNGTMFLEFGATKDFYVRQGCDFSECATDEEILEAMEAWDNRVVEPEVTTEERTAAALEYIAMSSLPDEENA